MMRKFWIRKPYLILVLLLILLPAIASAETYWVSPTGAAAWANCKSTSPLSGTSACSVATANTNLVAGDTAYLRGGTYYKTIAPASSGTSTSRITYQAYANEIPIFTVTTDFRWAIKLVGKSYITIGGIRSLNSGSFFFIGYGSSYNEIKNCVFDNGTADYSLGLITDSNTAGTAFAASTNNWIHHNVFTHYGKVKNCVDSGTVRIAGSKTDASSYNTFENNVFSHGGHDAFDIGGRYNVFRNNVFHNNEAYFLDINKTCKNVPANGYFGNRDVILTNYGNGVGTAFHTLLEGNRIGYGGTPPDDDGANGIENAGAHTVVRYNYIYANGLAGYYSKMQGVYNSSVRSGSWARVYQNSIYHNGFGDPSLGSGYQRGVTIWSYSTYDDWPKDVAVKNNIVYDNYKEWRVGTPNILPQVTYENNFNQSPEFVNPDLSNVESLTLPNLELKSSSPAIDKGGEMTWAVGSGSYSAKLVVKDALYFQDGSWGSSLTHGVTQFPDWIAIGSVSNVVQIKSVDYDTDTITLASPITWADGAPIWLFKKSDGKVVLYGSAPDIGAYEYGVPTTVTCTDADSDGYGLNCVTGADCNDNNAAVHPGATDICNNGIDEDCSGADLACTTSIYYCDKDSDGYNSKVSSGSCVASSCVPAGCALTAGTDCFDNDMNIHPGASEICGDGKDQDCSGADLACSSLACLDGTGSGACSPSKPLYCESGVLVNRCGNCGCPSGQTCNAGGTCVIPTQTCSDGTAYYQCSSTKPMYCSNGKLINYCSSCGCPAGQACNSDDSCGSTTTPTCTDGTAVNQCSSSKPLLCENGQLVSRCSACGCPAGQSCQPGGICSPDGQIINAGEVVAATCNLADVQAAIDKANPGDIVKVPAGNCIWPAGRQFTDSGQYTYPSLGINKSVILIGAGAGKTNILCAHSGFLIKYKPYDINANNPFRVSGFTFDLNNNCSGIKTSASGITIQTKLRIDHNEFTHNGGQVFWNNGMRGVFDNNIVKDAGYAIRMPSSPNDQLWWDNWDGIIFGAMDNNMYLEDNVFSGVNNIIMDCQYGNRYAFRYNTATVEKAAYAFLDMHGNQGSGYMYACFGGEIYGNLLTFKAGGQLLDQRAGKTVVFFNKINSSGGGIKTREEFDDSRNPTTNPQPQHVSDSYNWNNRNINSIIDAYEPVNEIGNATGGGSNYLDDTKKNFSVTYGLPGLNRRSGLVIYEGKGAGQSRLIINSTSVITTGKFTRLIVDANWNIIPDSTSKYKIVADCCDAIDENSEFFNYNTTFNGKAGVGCGALAARPSACTVGVGYFATNQNCNAVDLINVGAHPSQPISGTLYKCTATNSWTAYYTPLAYPHPLRTDCVKYPALCDASASPPACADADGDGYGASGSTGCPNPAIDCNDNNAAIHVGATEICGNTIDEDCSGADLACSQKCPDGTAVNQCSSSKPLLCENGALISRCSVCSCPVGLSCKANGSCGSTVVTGTVNAASCNLADVNASIQKAKPGDTVNVPAGTCTWDKELAITKGIILKGAGIDKTIIKGVISGNYGIISYEPASPTLNEPFRLTGFTLDASNLSNVVMVHNPTASIIINKIRIDHNKILNAGGTAAGRGIYAMGTVFGVIDNNIFVLGSGITAYQPLGRNNGSWASLPLKFGDADNMYFEDNVVMGTGAYHAAGHGGRYVARYNTYSGATKSLYPALDIHGNQPGKLYASMVAEIYGNHIEMGQYSSLFLDQRGGQALVFWNDVDTTGSTYARVREEYNDTIDGSSFTQHVNNSYYWNNRKNWINLFGSHIAVSASGTATGGGPNYLTTTSLFTSTDNRYGIEITAGKGAGQFRHVENITPTRVIITSNWETIPDITSQFKIVMDCCNELHENIEFYNQNDSFNGATGMGCGSISKRPATCTPGVGYWATEQNCSVIKEANIGDHPEVPLSGTLYKCTAANTWAAFYTPFAYPHPLRTDCVKYPTMCDAGSSVPVCTDADWKYGDGACQPTNTLPRAWIKINENCQGGVVHPENELVSCSYVPPAQGVSFEAESGALTLPFKIRVSGGVTSIYQSVLSGTSSGGRAVYDFNLATASDYVVKALVNASDAGSNSFFVNIDGEPTDPAMIWDIYAYTTGFNERLVSWRGSLANVPQYDPKIFNLAAGRHQLIVIGREMNAQLDKLSVIPYDASSTSGVGAGLGIAGDVDGDGILSLNDLYALINYLHSGIGFNPSMDVNQDGVVNIIDIVYIARQLELS